MPIHNVDIAAMFNEIADLLEIDGANPFRVRAYRNAARTVENLGQDAATLVEEGRDLTVLPAVGSDLASKIAEMVRNGKVAALEELRKRFPADIRTMLSLPGLGPKRVKSLYHDLGVTNLKRLEEAAQTGEIRRLPGLGIKSEQQILDAIAKRKSATRRFLRATVEPYADAYLAHLRGVEGVKKVAIAGSYRRARETVGDLDILAVAASTAPIMQAFVDYDEVDQVLAHGRKKSSVVLRSGIQVDLRVVQAESYGSAMYYFTGSQAHNIAVRRLGQQQGLKVNEYGLYRGDRKLAGRTEEEIFESMGLAFIPPELREDRGEVVVAKKDRLPRLVEVKHIRGDLHAHTTASDGGHCIREMAEAARERGYRYLAVTDHSKRLTVAHGLDEKRLLDQIEEIDRLDAELEGITLLKGTEVDILENGGLDLSNDVLSRLDLVVGSVHSRFKLSRVQQTERILRAMDNAYFTILGHPSGRLLLEREAYDVDMERIIRHAKERGCFLELNANPRRLDLDDIYCQMARDAGVLISVSTDAHRAQDLEVIRFGIGQARRGWLEKKDVLNTRNLNQLRPLLARTMG